jgi:hypothetical protein
VCELVSGYARPQRFRCCAPLSTEARVPAYIKERGWAGRCWLHTPYPSCRKLAALPAEKNTLKCCWQPLDVSATASCILPLPQLLTTARAITFLPAYSCVQQGITMSPASLACMCSLACRGRVSLHASLLEYCILFTLFVVPGSCSMPWWVL